MSLLYSQKTQDLIDRMCRNVEREDFRLQNKKAEECILKTYDIFNLKRPSKVVWFKDIFDKKYQLALDGARSALSALSVRSAWSALSARSARSAWSALSALSARSARSAWSALSALSVRSAWSALSALSALSVRSALSALSVRSAWSALSAGSALDYDFNYYVFEFEYCQNPDKEYPINENDLKYLEYCELLMKAKEYGLGYRVEYEDTLYLVPTPLVKIDEQNRFHSLTEPAIRWKGGKEFYFIHGVNFDKDLWNKVKENKLPAKDILQLENIEQRYIALKLYGAENLLKELDATHISTSQRGNELYSLDNLIEDRTLKLLKYTCPSTGRIYTKFVPDNFTDPDEAQAWSFQITKEEYATLKFES